MQETKSNLVIQTAFLGDLILAIPTLRRIKEIFPQDKLIVVCKQGLGDFLLKEKVADGIVEIKKSNAQSYTTALLEIKKINVKNIFCLHKSMRSQLFTSKIKADRKIGFSSFFDFLWGGWIFDDLVKYESHYPEAIRQFKILETTDPITLSEIHSRDYAYLNESSLPQIPPFFSFHRKVIDAPYRNSNLVKNKIKVAIFPGSVWATKRWTTSGFIELCKLFVQNKYQVHLFGSAAEKKLCEEIAESIKDLQIFAGHLTIAETIRTLANYDLVIANDSAPTHMAAYNNTPVITLFGPTTLDQGFRPWSDKAAVIENNTLDCRPCGRHGHKECPLGHHNCMKAIEAYDVFKKAEVLLANSAH